MERKLIIISNRLPYRIAPDAHASGVFGALTGQPACTPDTHDASRSALRLERSSGGLASALGPLHERDTSLWIGESDLDASLRGTPEAVDYEAALTAQKCVPVYLTADEQKGYYDGFSNSTVWPLFHGFSQYAHFDQDAWNAYEQVNRRFCEATCAVAGPDDIIWVQDYHLMLLPAFLREALPDASIGFFLHVPFPDYETFRMLPWRRQILEGLLGADLVGFHTYDYVRHFLSSCGRILGIDNHMGTMWTNGRMMQADVFPLGIDYQRFVDMGRSEAVCSIDDSMPMRRLNEGIKTMLSVERLDYTKGIPDRLRAFEEFLKRYPEWRERVSLTLITVPSRESVSSYKRLKKQVDQLVGRINGDYATISWSPINYFYRSLDFEQLCAVYRASDVMLVTPLRDGMNLVCKEYLAVHDGSSGVLILSEMAGAALELNEAVLVNPFDREALVEAMRRALTMPEDEQMRRNALMQRRLRRYTSDKWAGEFLQALDRVKGQQLAMSARLIGPTIEENLLNRYRAASHRAILLDYDGTLVPFSADPSSTVPDDALKELLGRLAHNPKNDVAILSGRDCATLEKWLGDLPVAMIAEHGVWQWNRDSRSWALRAPLDDSWKERIRPLLENYVDRTPGAMLEEKGYSLVWHYRACSSELAQRRVSEMKADLSDLVGDLGLQLADGNKIVEVKMADIDKGSAAYQWFSDESFDFTLVAGDDLTDEDMFRAAPDDTWTVKVGSGPTQARYALRNPHEMRILLSDLVACS